VIEQPKKEELPIKKSPWEQKKTNKESSDSESSDSEDKASGPTKNKEK